MVLSSKVSLAIAAAFVFASLAEEAAAEAHVDARIVRKAVSPHEQELEPEDKPRRHQSEHETEDKPRKHNKQGGKADDELADVAGADLPEDAEELLPLKEMNEIMDDRLMKPINHLCGGTDVKELERYPGPSGRLLVECRQACMDDKACRYYAYWPHAKDEKNMDGECKNNCRLYDKCSDHNHKLEAIADKQTCRVYLFAIGVQTDASRPEYAKTPGGGAAPPPAEETTQRAGAHSTMSISVPVLVAALLSLVLAK